MAQAPNEHGSHGSRRLNLAASLRQTLQSFAIAASLAAAFVGCIPGDDTGPGKPPVGITGGTGGTAGEAGSGGNGGTAGSGGAECADGDVRHCKVSLGQHGNITSCFEGEQVCANGEWGPCADPKPAEEPKPPPGDSANGSPEQVWMSLSMATACGTDPCDPTCQTFDEQPASPVGAPPEVLIAPWKTGNYGDLPSAIASAGTIEPCGTGADCQFDQYCYNPKSGGAGNPACSHSKCAVGGGLIASCDSCVQQICTAEPGCCNTPLGVTGTSTCAHDLCVVGGPLKGGATPCDPCVQTICAMGQYTSCCNTGPTGGWTSECVQAVTNVCGKSCNTGTWSQDCVDRVKTDCGAYCIEDTTAPVCTHDKCYLGGPLTSGCDTCVAQVCAVDSYCCTVGWDGLCLQEVSTICGEQCPAQGQCLPWLPTQTDPACGALDLTVGVGCLNAGVPQVPVCNHGGSTAPAGIPLVIYPPTPKVMPNYYVPYSGETVINTTAPIPGGDCINVTLPVGTLDGSQIAINPFNAPASNNTECHGSNNWSVWSSAGGSCATPSCAGVNADTKLKKVKLFMTVDKSASTCTPQPTNVSCFGIAGTRWANLATSLKTFIQDPSSDDLALWMRFWPSNVGGACPSPWPAGCGPLAGCKTANAEVADLASAANENTLITAIDAVSPSGTTPMYPALDGALIAARDFQIANPDYVSTVILVTDGEPTTPCNTNVNNIAAIAANAYNGYGIRTYVIGIAEVSQTTIEIIAGAGGGKAFIIGSSANVQTEMATALNSIKKDFVSCRLTLPNQDIFDSTKATLVFTPSMGAPQSLMNVGNSGACGAGDGWYYDDPANPTEIILCPTTCTSVKADVNAKLQLSIDCISQYLPSTYTQTYEAVCPPGTTPQWGFFAYDTTTPGDSRVEFRFRTSTDNLMYSALPPLPDKTASTALGSSVCGLGGPAPCPVSLYTTLNGLPLARQKYLEVVMDIFPTSDANFTPTINDWDVTYSCPDAE
ncbi:MAG: VWA domain-containing protein [Polyangiaceae bacterium]|nr:VWA domain-containing protein [Polyangiaceae bacterium]